MRGEPHLSPGLGDKKTKTQTRACHAVLQSRHFLGGELGGEGAGAAPASITGPAEPTEVQYSNNWNKPRPRADLPNCILLSSLCAPTTA